MGVKSATFFVRPHSVQMRTPGGNLGFGPGLLRVGMTDCPSGEYRLTAARMKRSPRVASMPAALLYTDQVLSEGWVEGRG
jgi:hypothetical protein